MKSVTPEEVAVLDVKKIAPLDLYNGDRLKLEVDKLEAEIKSLSYDPSDPKDYKHMGSIALKVSKFKTSADGIGKAITDPIKAQCKDFDAKRKMVRDRCEKIRNDFLQPRADYDAEVAAHAKAIKDAEELLRFGHLKLAEFKKPTRDEWKEFLSQIKECEVPDDLASLKAESIDLNLRRFSEFEETERALEAGRIALKEKEDAEAAARHEERLKKAREAENIKESPKALGNADSPAEKSTSEILRDAKNKVYGHLVNYGMPAGQAKKFVEATAADQINHLKIYI